MKGNSKKFLSLLLSASMAFSPVMGIQAEETVTEVQTESASSQTLVGVPLPTPETTAPTEAAAPAETETQAQTQPEVQTDAQTEAATETQTSAQSEAATEVQSEVSSEAVTEAQTETPTETQAQTEASEAETAPVTTPETEPVKEIVDNAKIKETKALSTESPDTESAYEADTDGATRAVDSSTTLADGVYVPESFTMTVGGSGKVTFSCPKVTVSGGQASATIVIGSSKYTYVKANAQKYNTTIDGSSVTVTFPVKLNAENTIIAYTTSMGGKEITYAFEIKLTEDTAESTTETPDEISSYEKDTSAFTAVVDNSTTLKDAVYTPDAFTSGKADGGSSKTVISCSKVTVQDGKAYATISFNSAAYTYVKVNGNKYTGICDETAKTSVFVIPVKLNEENTLIGYTSKMKSEIAYVMTITLSEDQQDTTETETTTTESETSASESETTATESETQKDTSSGTVSGEKGNGDYTIDVESSAAMFKVISAVLTVKDGTYTAQITLSGTGYDKLFIGTASDAAKASASQLIGYQLDENQKYVFTIPVAALDTPIAVAARSASKGTWFDRTLIFKSETMNLIGSEETEKSTESEAQPETETEKANTKNPEKESSSVADLSGSTSAVNNSTALADGVYTPDKFSWSGGSGRTSITCSKITVSGGQAYATIVFGSSNYAYVKANGRKYTGTVSGGTTSFTIPVQLNANNTIIGMTTAMSAAHEVTYSLYIYLAAADEAEKTKGADGSSEALEIVGLTYQSETKLEHAQLIHIYNYDDGITLVEIDMATDVEWAKEETEAVTETEEAQEAEAVAEDDAETPVLTKEEIMAELYQEDTVKYLIVPEDTEIPVGLEKEMIVVQIPAESIYVSSTEIMDILQELKQTENITSTGFETDDENLTFAGDMENLEFKKLVLTRCDLALFDAEILPKEAVDADAMTEQYEQVSSGFATLGVPMIVDRSEDEKSEDAKEDWMKLYEILFECGETNEK